MDKRRVITTVFRRYPTRHSMLPKAADTDPRPNDSVANQAECREQAWTDGLCVSLLLAD